MIARHLLGNAYPTRKLESVVEFLDHMRRPITESERKIGPYPYYGANGRQGWVDDFIFDEPLILLAEDGGHFDSPDRGVAYRIDGKTWVNNHAHVLRPSDEVDIGFLCRLLENYDLSPFVTGTTRGKLTKAGASEIPVLVPPFPEQRRIAAILDQAETLRSQRRAALARLDTLAPLIFVDMFGDIDTILKKWPTAALGASLDFLTSGSRGWAKHYVDDGDIFLRIQNVRRDELALGDVAYVSAPTTAEAKRTRVRSGDVLLSITADLGRTAVVPSDLGPAFINQHLCILRTRAFVPRFLSAYLASPMGQRQVSGRNKHAVKAGLNFDDIRSLQVPNPPLALQQTFATRIQAIESLKATHRAALAELDALFASLQHRAFQGQL